MCKKKKKKFRLSPCPKLALSCVASKLIHFQSNLFARGIKGDAGLSDPSELVSEILPSRIELA